MYNIMYNDIHTYIHMRSMRACARARVCVCVCVSGVLFYNYLVLFYITL